MCPVPGKLTLLSPNELDVTQIRSRCKAVSAVRTGAGRRVRLAGLLQNGSVKRYHLLLKYIPVA